MYYDMLKARRSIRKFSDREVEKEKLDIILKSALLSPSSRSIRPWEFVTVRDKETLKKLSESKHHGSSFLSDANLGIVVIADPEKCDVWVEDCSIASIIIQLAAESQGLGSCWIQIRERAHNETESAETYIKNMLGIPKKYCVLSIIAIGYPDEEKDAYDENRLPYDKLHFEGF
ncbi:MAG: NAD(P)H nitroreductase [Clostridiales bacterium]|nr:NAD(P)H nitroreductase [Clostridiales bacterium]